MFGIFGKKQVAQQDNREKFVPQNDQKTEKQTLQIADESAMGNSLNVENQISEESLDRTADLADEDINEEGAKKADLFVPQNDQEAEKQTPQIADESAMGNFLNVENQISEESLDRTADLAADDINEGGTEKADFFVPQNDQKTEKQTPQIADENAMGNSLNVENQISEESLDRTADLANVAVNEESTEKVDLSESIMHSGQNQDNSLSDEQKRDNYDYLFSEKNKRYVIGDVAGTFYQIPYPARKSDERAFYRNDIIADVGKFGELLVMGASLRGESHYAHKIPRQDSFLIEECVVNDENRYIICSIADGVGNAKRADEFSEMLVNFMCDEVSQELRKVENLEKLDWNMIAEKIWKISINFCYRKSGSKNLDDYFHDWASTLECMVVETVSAQKNRFVAVTISGDGGIYKLDASREWATIKHGKTGNEKEVSNLVYCLPDKPQKVIINTGILQRGEALFLVTDGLGDYIEEYPDVRKFFSDNLPHFHNLPEFIRVINVAVKQMDDDKTGIMVSFFEEESSEEKQKF